MMHSSVAGVAPSYINDMLTSVADMPGCERLRSTASGSFDVPRVRTCIGSQDFFVVGPQAVLDLSGVGGLNPPLVSLNPSSFH